MSSWLDLLILFETVKVIWGHNQVVVNQAVAPPANVVGTQPLQPVAVPVRKAAAKSPRRVRFTGNVGHTREA
jgi:hypothetical protein